MQESKRKHVVLEEDYHTALKIYSAKIKKSSKQIVKDALDTLPGFKECFQ